MKEHMVKKMSGTGHAMRCIALPALFVLCVLFMVFCFTASFARAESSYVTPQMFGAAADGQTDDSQAILDAINYAKEAGLRVYLPRGTYIVRHGVMNIVLLPGESLQIYGDGRSSLIRRMDDSLPSYEGKTVWAWLFHFATDKALKGTDCGDTGSVYIHDFAIDSNRRNQSNATAGYTHEASADMMFRPGAGGYFYGDVTIEDMYFYDGVADHIDFTASSRCNVRNVTLRNITAQGRQGTRNCIDFPGYIEGTVVAENIVCTRFHTEFNSSPQTDGKMIIRNINCRELTILGWGGTGQITIENANVEKRFALGSPGNAIIRNSTITLTGEQSNHYIIAIVNKDGREDPSIRSNITFEDCTFISKGTTTYKNETQAPALYIRRNSDVLFKNCVFDADTDYAAQNIKSFPVYTDGVTDISALKVTLDACRVSEKYLYGIMAYSADIVLKNMTFVNRYPAYFRCVNEERCARLTFENCINAASSGGGLYWEVKRHDTKATRPNTLVQGDMVCTAENFAVEAAGVGSYLFNENSNFDMHRVIYIDQPLNYQTLRQLYKCAQLGQIVLIEGDEFIYTGSEPDRYPEKWVVTKTVKGALRVLFPDNKGISKYIQTVGEGSGTSAQRPDCYLSEGFRYTDTEKNQVYIYRKNGWQKEK